MRAVIERDAIGIHTSNQIHHILHIISMSEQPLAHVSSTGVVDLVFLDMKTSTWQQINVARMVIM